MSDSDIGTHVPLSEVGCENQPDNDGQPHDQPSSGGLLANMGALLTPFVGNAAASIAVCSKH